MTTLTKESIYSLFRFFPIAGPLLLAFLLSHCGSVKHSEMLMLEDVQDETLSIDSIPALTIQPDDILGIQVNSRNPENVVAFQLSNVQSGGGAVGEQSFGSTEGYRVDENGDIFLPFLGKLKAQGKTIIQLREEITSDLIDYIPDASVQIRFLNFRVTVLGEVQQPNTYTIPNEKLTILEAIGMAGDFTPYARREAVLVIRERKDIREIARVNTQDRNLFSSSYFYLSPNDIIYIEPLKAKQYATQGDFMQRYSILLVPIISFGTVLLTAAIVN